MKNVRAKIIVDVVFISFWNYLRTTTLKTDITNMIVRHVMFYDFIFNNRYKSEELGKSRFLSQYIYVRYVTMFLFDKETRNGTIICSERIILNSKCSTLSISISPLSHIVIFGKINKFILRFHRKSFPESENCFSNIIFHLQYIHVLKPIEWHGFQKKYARR